MRIVQMKKKIAGHKMNNPHNSISPKAPNTNGNVTSSNALESEPRNLTAWIKIGEIHSYTNDVDKAMDIFSKLLEIDPQNRIALEYRRLFGEKC